MHHRHRHHRRHCHGFLHHHHCRRGQHIVNVNLSYTKHIKITTLQIVGILKSETVCNYFSGEEIGED